MNLSFVSKYNIEKQAETITKNFSNFTDGIRVQMLLDRDQNNTNSGSIRWVNKLISDGKDSFYKNIVKLLHQQIIINNPDIRLYGSVNSRSLKKSIKHFQHSQVELNTDDENRKFYTLIQDKFISCLMKPENRETKLILIDYDHDHENLFERFVQFLYKHIDNFSNKKLLAIHKTVKGYHVISEPFNPSLLPDNDYPYEIKKDALILLNFLTQEKCFKRNRDVVKYWKENTKSGERCLY